MLGDGNSMEKGRLRGEGGGLYVGGWELYGERETHGRRRSLYDRVEGGLVGGEGLHGGGGGLHGGVGGLFEWFA